MFINPILSKLIKVNKEKILQLFNYMNRIILEKGDFLFHQNDIDNNLYFIINGVFNLSINICFPWINDYIDYITNMKDNIIGYILVQKPNKFSSLFGTINIAKLYSLNNIMSK